MVRRYSDSAILKSDVMTVPHHGHDQDRYRARNGNNSFYDLVHPTATFFPATVEHFNYRKVAQPDDPFSNRRFVAYTHTAYIVNMCKDKCYCAGEDTYTLKMNEF